MKNMIQQLNISEIQEVSGGHDDGTHVHILGLHTHEIAMIVTATFITVTTLYATRPRLTIGAAVTATIGIIGGVAYKLWNTNDATHDD